MSDSSLQPMSPEDGAPPRRARGTGVWRSVLIWAVAPAALVVLLANVVWGGHVEPDPRKRIAAAMACRNYAVAEAEYRALIAANPTDLALHRGYLAAHFARAKRASSTTPRDDAAIVKEYEAWAAQPDPAMADVGNYGLGLAASLDGDDERAVAFFARVRNRSMPFLNNSLGYALRALGRDGEAEARFRAELALGGNTTGAIANLATLLYDERRLPDLERLAARPIASVSERAA